FSSVAFGGDGQTMQAVLGGHVMAAGISAGPSVAQLKAGKIRLLAIIDGTQRMSEYPGVPTLAEFSKPENVIPSSGLLIFAPKGLPAAITKKLEDTFIKAAHATTFRKWGEENQTFVLDKPLTGKELHDYLADQNKRMGALIDRLRLRPKS